MLAEGIERRGQAAQTTSEAGRRFVRGMYASFAEENSIKRDEITVHQLHAL